MNYNNYGNLLISISINNIINLPYYSGNYTLEVTLPNINGIAILHDNVYYNMFLNNIVYLMNNSNTLVLGTKDIRASFAPVILI